MAFRMSMVEISRLSTTFSTSSFNDTSFRLSSMTSLTALADKFENSLILGDSRAASIYEYNILDQSYFIAYKGRNILTAKSNGEIEKAINLAPKNIFLTYGLNDVENFDNTEEFIQKYSEIINDIKRRTPHTKIYVNSI